MSFLILNSAPARQWAEANPCELMNKPEIDQDSRCLVTVTEAWTARAGLKAAKSAERARWYCEQLEQGRILFFKTIPFPFPEADQEFLRGQRLGDSRLHKNICIVRPRTFSVATPATIAR